MTYDFNNYENDELTRPRDKAFSNFFKSENIGDKVQGYIRDVFYKPAEGVYKEQRGITLEQEDGELVNVAIKTLPFILAKTDHLRIGDPLTVVFESEKDNGPGKNPTKIIGYYGKNLDENTGKTVKELYEIDKRDQNVEGVLVTPEETPKAEEDSDEPFPS